MRYQHLQTAAQGPEGQNPHVGTRPHACHHCSEFTPGTGRSDVAVSEPGWRVCVPPPQPPRSSSSSPSDTREPHRPSLPSSLSVSPPHLLPSSLSPCAPPRLSLTAAHAHTCYTLHALMTTCFFCGNTERSNNRKASSPAFVDVEKGHGFHTAPVSPEPTLRGVCMAGWPSEG